MKFLNSTFLIAATAVASFNVREVAAVCRRIVPNDAGDMLGVKVTYKGNVTANTPYPWSYNMAVAENFDDKVMFFDQKDGTLYSFTPSTGSVTKLYDTSDKAKLPVGVDIDGVRGLYSPWRAGIKKIHQVAPGPDANSIIIVFTSKSLPERAWPIPTLPDKPNFRLFDQGECGFDGNVGDNTTVDYTVCDVKEIAPMCCRSQKVFKLFYKFNLIEDVMSQPDLFFAYEMQISQGHDGGSMLTVPDGRILFGTGDCLPYGTNGLHESQDLNSHCGKILLLDPRTANKKGQYEIAAVGVRNSQQMNLEGEKVIFMDIGGVTAEEINAVPLEDLLDTAVKENFGWGMKAGESRDGQEFGREGTFIVEKGTAYGNLSADPPCIDEQTDIEKQGFIAPYMQFGRGTGLPFYGISSSVVSSKSFNLIKVASTEFNTGLLIVGLDKHSIETAPVPAYMVKLYKEDSSGELIEMNGFNAFVGGGRGDPRLFKYPDGSAGVFIERTGQFFTLEEVMIPQVNATCLENRNDRYAWNKNKVRGCSKLARFSPTKLSKRCKKTEAKDMCQITCNTCPVDSCKELFSDNFFFTKRGKNKVKSCHWLQRRAARGQDNTKICNFQPGSVPKPHRVARDSCPVTCGTCASA